MFSFKDNQFMKVESLKKQLQILIDKANSKDDDKVDIILFRRIDAIGWCMKLLGYISEEERENLLQNIKGYKQYFDIVFINSNRSNKEIIKNNSTILKKYWELYKYYQHIDDEYNETNVNQSKMEKATYEFFEMMGCMKLYEEMNNKDMITRYNAKNQAWCINNCGLSYILLSDTSKNDSHYYTDLVHEMGHAYSNYILKDGDTWKYNYPIYAEISSYMFERIFFQFIYDNSFLSIEELRKIIAHFEAVEVNSLYIGIGTSQIIESNEYCINEEGLIIPSEYWINKFKSKSIFSTREEIDYYAPWISMLRYPYIIGNMGSIKLVMDYIKNSKGFISKLPETITTFSEMPVEQLIEEYCSVNDFEPFFVNNFYDYKVKKKQIK